MPHLSEVKQLQFQERDEMCCSAAMGVTAMSTLKFCGASLPCRAGQPRAGEPRRGHAPGHSRPLSQAEPGRPQETWAAPSRTARGAVLR